MSRNEPFWPLDFEMRRWAEELELKKTAFQTLKEYEEQNRQAAAKLKGLADDSLKVWESTYSELKEQTVREMEQGHLTECMERLEDFLPRIKEALTDYRRNKSEADLRFKKAPIDLSQWSKKGEVRSDVVREVKSTEQRVSELVKEAIARAASALQYLRDIKDEAQTRYKALQAKQERAVVSPFSDKATEFLQVLHSRLTQAGKVNMSYRDFASLLREGRGSFHFEGRQNDLAYLLLFLNKNGFAANWKGLNLSYLKNGVAAKTRPDNIKDAQKKLSSRNEPEIKPLLARLKESFPEITIP